MRPWIRKVIVSSLAFPYRRGADEELLRQALFRVFEKRRTRGWCEKLWADVEEAGRTRPRQHCCAHPGTGICMCDCHDRGCDCGQTGSVMRNYLGQE